MTQNTAYGSRCMGGQNPTEIIKAKDFSDQFTSTLPLVESSHVFSLSVGQSMSSVKFSDKC